MTLIVSAYRRDPATDAIAWLPPPELPRTHLAGTEGWREGVWGSTRARTLGLRLLSTLAVEDVYAEEEELFDLAREVDLATAGVKQLAADEVDVETLLFRLANIRAAIALARAVPDGLGGVYIG